MSFDKYASKWDTPRRIERAEKISVEIRKSLIKSKYEEALEFGCGTGLISFNLIDLMNRITMVDISKEMIEIVKEKAIRNSYENIKPLNIDIMKSVFETKYDVIYSSMAFHHVVNIEEILKKLYDIMNLNGEICIVDLNKEDGSFHANHPGFDGHNGFEHDELKKAMKKVGFKNIDIQTFYKDVKEIDGNRIAYSLFRAVGTK